MTHCILDTVSGVDNRKNYTSVRVYIRGDKLSARVLV